MMPVTCVAPWCDVIIWRPWQPERVIQKRKMNVPGRVIQYSHSVIPETPTFQEYCKACMTEIRDCQAKLFSAMDRKDLDGLRRAIAKGHKLGVAKDELQDADYHEVRFQKEQWLQHAVDVLMHSRPVSRGSLALAEMVEKREAAKAEEMVFNSVGFYMYGDGDLSLLDEAEEAEQTCVAEMELVEAMAAGEFHRNCDCVPRASA